MDSLTVGDAAARTGWSSRMLRYLDDARLVVPDRSPSGYRLYGLRHLNQLRALAELRERFAVDLSGLAFLGRIRREPALRAAVETWFAGAEPASGEAAAWVDWEQRKHERLLAA